MTPFFVGLLCNSSRLRLAGWKGDTSEVAGCIQRHTSAGNANVVLAPHWIDKQIVYYLDSAHTAFQTEGRVDEPVFEPYLTRLGWFYDGGELCPRRDTVLVVHERWWDVSGIERHLADLGNCRVDNVQFQQIEILFYAR